MSKKAKKYRAQADKWRRKYRKLEAIKPEKLAEILRDAGFLTGPSSHAMHGLIELVNQWRRLKNATMLGDYLQ